MANVRSITPLPPANFTPEMGNYKTLQPFRYWCQKVLPLVYDDSISYYELLCKVVDYLNKTMEDVETLHGDVTGLHEAYVQLQNYVNTYFSSLDVQEEINNKLDTMASDGTLLEIIEPTISATTISEVNKWLSEHITNPSNPPIDTSLTISGAAADSKTVGNNFKKVEEDLTVQKVVPMTSVNPYNVYLKDYDVRIYSGKYLTGFSTSTYTPTMTQGSDFPYDVIDMKINLNNPTITVPFDTEQSVGQTFVLYTEGVQANNATPDNVRNEQIGVIDVTGTSYTVNLNASGLNYVRVAFTVPKNKRDFYFSKPDEGELGKLIDNKISSSSDALAIKVLNEQKVIPMASINPYNVYLKDYDVKIYPGKYVTGYNTQTFTPSMPQGSGFPYDVIDMKINLNNPTITVPFDTEQSVGQTFVLYTEGVQANNATPDNVRNEQIGVIDVTGTSYTVNLNASGLNYVRVAFTVPKNKRDFYFSKPDEGELGKLIDDKLITACVNMFYSIGAIGDSYTAGSALSSDGKTWQDVTDLSWIATMGKRAGIYWSNYGKGGATTKSYITDKLPSVLSGQAKDLYFIALGINDCLQELPIGTISDIKSNYSENGESFYGWYGSIIAQVQDHAPKAKIVLVKIWTNGTAKIPYDNAIDKIAEHFELPVINPFDDYFFNSSLYLNNMVSGHPTAMGYSSMGVAMERLFSRCVVENPSYFKYATIG